MRRWNRSLTTLLAAAAAGCLLWFVPHFHRWTTGGYWGVIGLLALAGLLVGISQLHGREGKPVASFLLAFLPVLVTAGWVILAAEPRGSWVRDHVLSWGEDLGTEHAVHNLGEHVAVLAFGLGLIFGVTFEPAMLRRRKAQRAVPAAPLLPTEPAPEAPTPDEHVADDTEIVERESLPPPV